MYAYPFNSAGRAILILDSFHHLVAEDPTFA